MKKRRECEIKLKKKNEEKEMMKMLYKMEEGKKSMTEDSNYSKIKDIKSKRRAKVYRRPPISEKMQEELLNRQKMVERLISHSMEKSQKMIKKLSEKIH